MVPVQLAQNGVKFDPFAQVGLVKFDGAGNVTVNVRIQFHGQITNAAYVGTYSIEAGCSGAANFKDGDTVTMRWEFVVADSGAEIETMALMPKSATRPMFSVTFRQRKI
jgi:hypothetical protein